MRVLITSARAVRHVMSADGQARIAPASWVRSFGTEQRSAAEKHGRDELALGIAQVNGSVGDDGPRARYEARP
jgi:hypothetical protein